MSAIGQPTDTDGEALMVDYDRAVHSQRESMQEAPIRTKHHLPYAEGQSSTT